jgi:hypothetical protein
MMHENFHLEPLLATGYTLLLLAIAGGLEWMGRHSHRRADQYHTSGFRFRKDAGHWECPMGTPLHLVEANQELRVIRYRAPARACNGCSMKPDCTDSDHGRVISVPMDPWLSSAIGGFHRGMSLLILALAGLIIAIEIYRHKHGIELPVLVAVMVVTSLLGINMVRGLRERVERRSYARIVKVKGGGQAD